MRTVKLNTRVEILFDNDDNMISVTSPYDKNPPTKMTKLRWYVYQIKQIINN